jgi:hypothetical protein
MKKYEFGGVGGLGVGGGVGGLGVGAGVGITPAVQVPLPQPFLGVQDDFK